MRRINVPVVQNMCDPSADEPADDDCDRERIDPIVSDQVPRGAERHDAPRDHPDEREDRVPGEAERSDVKVRIEGKVDQTAKVRVCALQRVVRRNSTVTEAANTRSPMVWSCRRP